ncbi:MAG TPA: ATP-binding protein [Ktedonobacteraceae bacterium]|nr:ATP-binding protein [Ktedonobacteraceae bacterium]
MSKTPLIIISGPPCTGKTTLGKRLANDLNLPFVHKDGIKELLFDKLGWSDRAWSRTLGIASYALLYYFLETQLRAGRSCIVESNFHAEFDREQFLALKAKYDFEPLQICCIADGEVLFSRFKDRAATSERHPGHVESVNLEEFKQGLLRGRDEVMDIGGTIFEIDTTDFERVDYEGLVEGIRRGMKGL